MPPKSPRINFTPATIRLVEQLAGSQCSYPSCGRRTSGPGAKPDERANTGTAAHIYSAAEHGPRGRGGLSEEELKHATNAIWLCREHGTLIDTNRGDKFPPELLLSFKQLQEARIAREHQGLYSPVAWFHQIGIARSPVFLPNSSATLAKLNLLIGDNGSGKTAICEWLSGLFDISSLSRWIKPNCELQIALDAYIPQDLCIELQMTDDMVFRFRINGQLAPTNPYHVNLIRPATDPREVSWHQKDDLKFLSEVLRVHSSTVKLRRGQICC